MTPDEMKAFTAKVRMDGLYAGKIVLVRAPQNMGGLYLSQNNRFDSDRAGAYRFDYDRQKVGEQVQQSIAAGMPVEVELADPEDAPEDAT